MVILSSPEASPAALKLFQIASIDLHPTDPDTREIRTLPELVEFNALHNPDYLFCLQARRQPKEPLSVTHGQMKEAILRSSDWLLKYVKEVQLPDRQDDGTIAKGPPVALLMENDIGLWIHLLSLLSLGVPVSVLQSVVPETGGMKFTAADQSIIISQVILLSARLSANAITHLVRETSAVAILIASRLRGTTENALALFSSTSEPDHLPVLYPARSYEDILHDDNVSGSSICHSYHYTADADRNVLILHSSGTTGLPKPIYASHRYLLGFAACHDFPNKEDAQALNVSTLPLFHVCYLLPWFIKARADESILGFWPSCTMPVIGHRHATLPSRLIDYFQGRFYCRPSSVHKC